MISSGLFILPGLAFARAGPSVILAYLLAGILLIPPVLSKAELVTAMPKSGGIYFFIHRSTGPGMGTVGGLAAWFSLSFKTAFALLGIGIFILLFNPGFTEMQIKLVAIACCLFFTLINIIGVKLTGRFQVAMVVALLGLLAFYVISGSFSVQFHRYTPFMPLGLGSVLATAGMVYVSYGGLTKICAVAGEAKNPGRDLPLALLLTLIVMAALYVVVVFITVGLVDSAQLQNSLVPISLGASTFMGRGGSLILGLAALLAFITTANAGILAASRDPMAMGEDKLVPGVFGKVSKRGTPWFSILFTSGFMLLVILFLDLENLIKTASTLKLLMFTLANWSVIFMRESKLKHYQPKFRSPLYPWVQILGIIGECFLISMMGGVPLLIVGIFIVCAWGWYWFYARGKTKSEYALLHVVERITGIKLTSSRLDKELREISKERDELI
ncbi:putative amino acid permease YhdG [subsurface metagenome]